MTPPSFIGLEQSLWKQWLPKGRQYLQGREICLLLESRLFSSLTEHKFLMAALVFSVFL